MMMMMANGEQKYEGIEVKMMSVGCCDVAAADVVVCESVWEVIIVLMIMMMMDDMPYSWCVDWPVKW